MHDECFRDYAMPEDNFQFKRLGFRTRKAGGFGGVELNTDREERAGCSEAGHECGMPRLPDHAQAKSLNQIRLFMPSELCYTHFIGR
jgi:hypothetical protein